MIEAIKEAADHNHMEIEDINWLIPHQANLRMFQPIAKSLRIPKEMLSAFLSLAKALHGKCSYKVVDHCCSKGFLDMTDFI